MCWQIIMESLKYITAEMEGSVLLLCDNFPTYMHVCVYIYFSLRPIDHLQYFFSVTPFLKYLIFITLGKMQEGDVLLFYFPMYTSEYHVFAYRPSSNFSRTLPFAEHGGLMHWCCSALQ